jgi:hypothetical protein
MVVFFPLSYYDPDPQENHRKSTNSQTCNFLTGLSQHVKGGYVPIQNGHWKFIHREEVILHQQLPVICFSLQASIKFDPADHIFTIRLQTEKIRSTIGTHQMEFHDLQLPSISEKVIDELSIEITKGILRNALEAHR